jgi:hypothetical protein
VAKQSFHLAGKTYTVKEQIKTNVRHIAAMSKIRVPLSGKYFHFMRDLFAYHPRADSKIGVGIEIIEVRIATRNRKNREFWLKPIGSDQFTDISWLECLNATSAFSEFRNACRLVVKATTQAFADHEFATTAHLGRVRCPITGELFDREHAHVDHDDPWPFTKIVETFVSTATIDIEAVRYDGFERGSTFITLDDDELAKQFVRFHNSVAMLRVVSDKGNLSRG